MKADRRGFLKLSSALIASSAFTPELLASAVSQDSSHDGDWGMLNDEIVCTGCKTCTYVCKQRVNMPAAGPTEYYDDARFLNADQYTIVQYYPGDKAKGYERSYVKRQCMHCNDPGCVAACPVHALVKREDGPVTYDADKCIGCRYCMVACPFDIPAFEYDSATPKIQKCDLCVDQVVQEKPTVCSAVCPTDSIITGKRKDLIEEAWRRIKAHPDRYVDHVYGEHEVGGTAVVYLSGVPFSELGLADRQTESVAAMPRAIQHGIFKYFVSPIALFGMLAVTRGAMLKCDPNEDAECIEE